PPGSTRGLRRRYDRRGHRRGHQRAAGSSRPATAPDAAPRARACRAGPLLLQAAQAARDRAGARPDRVAYLADPEQGARDTSGAHGQGDGGSVMIRILLFAAALQAAAPNTDATGPMQAAARTPHDAERIVATLATPRALLQLEAMTRAGREEPVVESGETLHRRVEPAADATIGELAAGAGQYAGNASRPHRGSELRARAATWIAYTRAASVAAADGAMRMAASGAATVRPMVHNAGALIRRGTTAPAAPMVAGGAAAALCIALAAIVIVRRRRARAADTATASVREARALVRHGIATVEVARRTGLPRDAAALLELRRRPDTAPSRTQRRVAPA